MSLLACLRSRVYAIDASIRSGGDCAHLLHDTGLALGKGDVTTRLVGDEFDLNLPPLATGLVIIIVIVVGSGWALALHSTVIGRGRAAISYGMRVLEYGWRRLVGLLISDVGHSQ